MKRCEEFQDALWEAAENSDLKAHLAECETCRATRESLASARHGFTTLQRVCAPDPRAALRARRAALRRRRGYALAFMAAACVLGVAVLVPRLPRKVEVTRSSRPTAALKPAPPAQVPVQAVSPRPPRIVSVAATPPRARVRHLHAIWRKRSSTTPPVREVVQASNLLDQPWPQVTILAPPSDDGPRAAALHP